VVFPKHDPPFEKGPILLKKIFGKFWGKPDYVWGIDYLCFMGNNSEEDIKHLQWIYDRMVNVHGENENYDYMIKFKEIIEQLKK
jgi:hypothetical protein